jgi:XTP/dITP diphosphohydrolase
MKYVFATGNSGKLREIAAIFNEAGLDVSPLPDKLARFEAVENGDTFDSNARMKAVQWLEWLGANGVTDTAVLADDSGLSVDYLHGAPGILSARFMGEDTPYSVKNAEILRLLADCREPERTARFECAIACAFPDGRMLVTEGAIEGVIAREPHGEGGFGYDPIFFVPEYSCTTAELPFDIKNRISHRGKALRKMCKRLMELT